MKHTYAALSLVGIILTSHSQKLNKSSSFVREHFINSYVQFSKCALYRSRREWCLSSTCCAAICNLETNCFYYSVKTNGLNYCDVCIGGIPETPELRNQQLIVELFAVDSIMVKSGWEFWFCFGENGTPSSVELHSGPSGFSSNNYLNFDFKTTAENGVMVYVVSKTAAISPHTFVMYLRSGQVWFTVSNRGGVIPTSVNDGVWHNIELKSNNATGYLRIDGETTYIPEGASVIDENVPKITIGRLPDQFVNLTGNAGFSTEFVGCLRNFRLYSGSQYITLAQGDMANINITSL